MIGLCSQSLIMVYREPQRMRPIMAGDVVRGSWADKGLYLSPNRQKKATCKCILSFTAICRAFTVLCWEGKEGGEA